MLLGSVLDTTPSLFLLILFKYLCTICSRSCALYNNTFSLFGNILLIPSFRINSDFFPVNVVTLTFNPWVFIFLLLLCTNTSQNGNSIWSIVLVSTLYFISHAFNVNSLY